MAIAVVVVIASMRCGKSCRETTGSSDMKAHDQAPFDVAGWVPDGPQRWRKTRGASLEWTSAMPQPLDLRNESRFRDAMRGEILRRGGGLVSAEVSPRGASRFGRVLAKFPQKPSGMTYEAWLLFERRGAGHRVTVRATEQGITGVRDTAGQG